jgi:hypothetical protein
MRLNTREFDRTLRQYMEHSKRDWAQIFNTKGYFIARRATTETPKANAAKIRALRERRIIGTGLKFGKNGPRKVTVRDPLSTSRAALILQARRRAAGQPGYTAKELPAAVKKFIGARLRSIGYLKSGWIPAIKKLEPLADVRAKPRVDNSGKVFKQPKGGAKPARNLWRTTCQIFNAAVTKKSGDEGLRKFGQAGLQAAFAAELVSMKDYVERKLAARAKRLAIRTR